MSPIINLEGLCFPEERMAPLAVASTRRFRQVYFAGISEHVRLL